MFSTFDSFVLMFAFQLALDVLILFTCRIF